MACISCGWLNNWLECLAERLVRGRFKRWHWGGCGRKGREGHLTVGHEGIVGELPGRERRFTVAGKEGAGHTSKG